MILLNRLLCAGWGTLCLLLHAGREGWEPLLASLAWWMCRVVFIACVFASVSSASSVFVLGIFDSVTSPFFFLLSLMKSLPPGLSLIDDVVWTVMDYAYIPAATLPSLTLWNIISFPNHPVPSVTVNKSGAWISDFISALLSLRSNFFKLQVIN